MQKIIFDTETNGLKNCSVLSFSALIIDNQNNILQEIDRYYFRNIGESINDIAIQVNGLSDEVIKNKRKNATYPLYFKDDIEILNIIKNSDLLICHNVNFDLGHIKRVFNDDLSNKKTFCTMKAVQYLYDAPYYVLGEPKFPKLSEALEYYNINADDLRKKLNLDFHNSLFDVYCTYEIFKIINKEKEELITTLEKELKN